MSRFTKTYKTILIATFVYISVHSTNVAYAAPDQEISSCTDLNIADTRYILTATSTGNCVISANNIIIDGQGLYGIVGNVTSETQNIDLRNLNVNGYVRSYSAFHNNLGNISVASSTVFGDVQSYSFASGNSGSISVVSSTVSGSMRSWINGNSGSISVASSTVSGGAQSYALGVGNAGNISIASSTIAYISLRANDLGNISITDSILGSVNTYSYSSSAGGNVTIASSTVGEILTTSFATNSDESAGSISVTNSTTTAITSVGYGNNYCASSGNISITDSQTSTITSTGCNSYGNGGNSGSISVTNSTTNSVISTGGYSYISAANDGGSSGSIYIATSIVDGDITSTGGLGYNSGSSGSIFITDSHTGIINSIVPSTTNYGLPGPSGSIFITANSIVGNVYSAGGSSYYNGSYSGSITISDGVTAENVYSTGGNGGQYYNSSYRGGNTGPITISANSTVRNITSTGGGSYGNGGNSGDINISSSIAEDVLSIGGVAHYAGSGGDITITDSTTGSISSIGANSGAIPTYFGLSTIIGTGGDIAIINTNGSLYLLGKIVTTTGGIDDPLYNGTLTVNSDIIITNSNTIFNSIGSLIINGVNFGPWDGVFNPTIYYFDDKNTSDGDWNKSANWWIDMDRTVAANIVPVGTNTIKVYSSITQNTGSAPIVGNITFFNSSANSIPITTTSGAVFNGGTSNVSTITGTTVFNATSTNVGTTTGITTFNDSSSNTGVVINSATTTFNGNLTNSSGIVKNAGGATSTPIIRNFTATTTTTRNFLTEAGHNNWIVVADGIPVDISGAVYNTTTNKFKALNGGSFVTGANVGGQVVPNITVSSPVQGTTTIKWLPSISWDTASSSGATCEYKLDSGSYQTLVCGRAGNDIPKPGTTGSHTLYIRGTDSRGDISELVIPFTYDKTSPTYTTCGTDFLDEETRQYYYLANDVTGDCKATVSTTLSGNSTLATSTNNGYTLTGNIIATSTTTGLNITLKGITVTGSIFASAANNNSGTGFSGGTITISTSTTGNIYAQGGNGTTAGGAGGTVNITNSKEIASSTLINANGGNATTCGPGGDGGDINLTNSTFTGSVTSEGGSAENNPDAQHCNTPSPSHSSGSRRNPSVVGTYTAPSGGGSGGGTSNTNTVTTRTTNSGSTRSYVPGTLNGVFIPVNSLQAVKLKSLPSLLDSIGNFNPNNSIDSFLFAPLPLSASAILGLSPELKKFINTLGLTYAKDLAQLQSKPLSLPATTTVPGIFTVVSNNKTIPSTVISDKKYTLMQNVKVTTEQTLGIILNPLKSTTNTAYFNGEPVSFDKKSAVVITVPSAPGRYILTSTGAAWPLAIDVVAPSVSTSNTPSSLWSRVKSWLGGWFR